MAGVSISGDLDGIANKKLVLIEIQIADVPPVQKEKFEDPFKYIPEDLDEVADPPAENLNRTEDGGSKVDILIPKDAEFKYLLGDEHKKDMKGGDAGGLMKRPEIFPVVDFVRSSFNGKVFNSLQHSDVAVTGNSKSMRAYFVTTGFFVAYTSTFDVKVYNI